MTKQIPLKEVPIGIDMAKDLAQRHIKDARTLVASGAIEGATILTVYALEELGRILILKDRIEKARINGDDYIELKDRREDPFYWHTKKQEKAKKLLPPDSLRLHKGAFGKGFGKGFDIDSWLDQDLRECVTYIDYCYYWQKPPSIDVDKLENCVMEIEKAIRII